MTHVRTFAARLGVDYPVIQAPMAGGSTTPALVAAVSNAGALGSIGAGYLSADAIREAIDRTREQTDRVFALNLFVPGDYAEEIDAIEHSNTVMAPYRDTLGIERPVEIERYAPDFEAQFEAVAEARLPVVSFTFGIPAAAMIERLHDCGTVVIGTATSVAEAQAIEAAGMDMVVAQGAEAGGHRGTFIGPFAEAMVGTLALVPQVVDAVSIPVIASGGIMDSRGVAAGLVLGAQAVQMGSAFLVCEQSGANPAHKRALLAATDTDTTVTRVFSGKPARGLKNRFIDDMSAHEAQLPDYPVQNAWTKDIRAAAGKLGETDYMSLWGGQAAALGRSVTAQALVERIAQDMGWR